MKIKPLNNNVLIEIEREQEVTKSGIIISTGDTNTVTEKAKVISPGASEVVKKGDTIYYKAYSLSPIEIDGKTYHFIKEEEILAIQG
ncbi:MAG: co-chaperone GroES [Gallionella sp.]|jgi:co-chaperonin GroES (HSP10)